MSNNTTCYKSDGTESPDIPCGFPNLSTCCGDGWDCLSNGLCRQHGTTGYSQSTCTNPSYENCLSFCNQSQFDGFTEVSRCDANGNSWCCAGAAGQGLGGPECCDTTGTTSLEPYPFSAFSSPGQSTVARSSILSSPTLTTSILSSLTLTTSTSLSSTFTSVSSPSFSRITSIQSTSQSPVVTSTQILSTPSQTSSVSPSPHSTDQGHSPKTGIEVGIPVAIVVVLLAVLAFFVFQNRSFKTRLLELRNQTGEGSGGRGHARPEMQEYEGDPVAELDLTHYELSHPHAPRHELLGNQVHELNHHGILEHELVGDGPRR